MHLSNNNERVGLNANVTKGIDQHQHDLSTRTDADVVLSCSARDVGKYYLVRQQSIKTVDC